MSCELNPTFPKFSATSSACAFLFTKFPKTSLVVAIGLLKKPPTAPAMLLAENPYTFSNPSLDKTLFVRRLKASAIVDLKSPPHAVS